MPNGAGRNKQLFQSFLIYKIKMLHRLLIISALLMATACVSDSEEDLVEMTEGQCATTVSFQSEINTIINTSCAIPGCHNGDNGASRNWTIFSNVEDNAQALRARTTARTMPPPGSGVTITDEEIDLIACWVQQGAQNN